MPNSYKSYWSFSVGVSGVILFLIIVFNFFIDPVGAFNAPSYYGINKSKPEQYTHQRLYKALDVIRLKPSSIILGSSRVQNGMDPKYYNVLRNEKIYNLGLTGPNMYEELRYFQHALYNQAELKTVIIGIDFFSFNDQLPNKPDFIDERLEKNNITKSDFTSILFSKDALDLSIKTIYNNKLQPDYVYFSSDGAITEEQVLRDLDNRKMNNVFAGTLSGFMNSPILYQNYTLSDKQLDCFRELVKICRERTVNLTVFISPSHVSQMEAIRASGLWISYEQWKREITKITPVWDFSGYYYETAEPISNSMEYFTDSHHYTKTFGNLILRSMFSREKDTAVGTMLTQDNIEEILLKIRKDRELWASNNIEIIKWVEQQKK